MYIRVKVVAGVKKEKFTQTNADHFETWVKEKAERNMANKRVLALVAEHFGINESKVRIVSGHHHPTKLLSIQIEQ